MAWFPSVWADSPTLSSLVQQLPFPFSASRFLAFSASLLENLPYWLSRCGVFFDGWSSRAIAGHVSRGESWVAHTENGAFACGFLRGLGRYSPGKMRRASRQSAAICRRGSLRSPADKHASAAQEDSPSSLACGPSSICPSQEKMEECSILLQAQHDRSKSGLTHKGPGLPQHTLESQQTVRQIRGDRRAGKWKRVKVSMIVPNTGRPPPQALALDEPLLCPLWASSSMTSRSFWKPWRTWKTSGSRGNSSRAYTTAGGLIECLIVQQIWKACDGRFFQRRIPPKCHHRPWLDATVSA